MKLTIIAAMAANRIIGKDNALPWSLPSDLKHFKQKTLGHPMIMGRKTFESFGARPLPNRHHIVLSRSGLPSCPDHSDQVSVAESVEAALAIAKRITNGEVFVIGGANIYEQFMTRADKMILTRLDASYEGDTLFPEIGERWKLLSETAPAIQELPYVIQTYVRL